MKILVSWLREFVDVTAPPEELGRMLSMVGFELASVEKGTGIFSAPPAVGKDSRPLFEDVVLDFEITANRPDCLSVGGLAREAATAYSLPLRPLAPKLKPLPQEGHADITVKLEAPDLCPRYAAAVFDVTIGPSPAWLANRLQAAGVRPINNVVDVTNYVLLELGQPMHAFDLAKLAGRELRIRRGYPGERITTLDGVDRLPDKYQNSSSFALFIADAEQAQAIAGVMGGALSEISSSTKAIVLESACFTPKAVRMATESLELKTEASTRFERGTDIGAPVVALERAAALLEEIGAGRVRGPVIDKYPNPIEPKRLALERARIERVLGQAVPDSDVERILGGLGFEPRPGGTQNWTVTVPTFRVDVSREVDLVEEVGRHHGYDKLPTTFPALDAPPRPPDPRIERDRLIRRVLLAAGCSEALNFPFLGTGMHYFMNDSEGIVRLANPLAASHDLLRPSLLPGLLGAVVHNRNRQQPDVKLFEIGATYSDRRGETRRVGVAWIGEASAPHWSGGRRTVDFFDVKGLVERVTEVLQVECVFDATSLPAFIAPGRGARVTIGDNPIGAVGMLIPAIVSNAGLAAGEEVYVMELSLDALNEARPDTALTVKPPPRFPSSARDISIIVDDVLPAETVRGTIRSAAPETLVSVREFDRYQGKGVPEDRVSLSLRLTFRSSERTLTDVEVQKAIDTIVAALVKEHKAVQR